MQFAFLDEIKLQSVVMNKQHVISCETNYQFGFFTVKT